MEAEKAMLTSLPASLCKVLYSSGDGISAKGSTLDWVFVEAAIPPGANKLPHHESAGLCNMLPNDYALASEDGALPGGNYTVVTFLPKQLCSDRARTLVL